MMNMSGKDMLNEEGIKEYWQEQTKKGDNPCHYHNKWQDKYASKIRTSAFRKRDFSGAKRVVDIGCGIGDYMAFLSRLSPAKFIGFDFPFNINIAKEKHAGNSRLEFRDDPLPSAVIEEEVRNADVVTTTTVYVHLAGEARKAFLQYVQKMQKGGKVMLLEYAPDVIPSFQKNIAYKEVETPAQIIEKFQEHGFQLKELRSVNTIDSFLFFHMGKNFFTCALTLALDRLLRAVRYPKSKYKLFIFEKE